MHTQTPKTCSEELALVKCYFHSCSLQFIDSSRTVFHGHTSTALNFQE